MYVCLWFESTPVDSYNLSSHYCSLALKDTRGAPRLGVVVRLVTLANISKIIREPKTLDTGMSLWIRHSVHINNNKHLHVYTCTY